MKQKLTVIIPCKNERKNIRPCIESAKLVADEVLVADSGSTDGTLDIVREIGGCRIVEREYINSGNFKNWAIPQAAHRLGADRRRRRTRHRPLAEEIGALLDDVPRRDGYHIYRANYFLGHRVRHGGWGRTKSCDCSAATWAAMSAKAITPKSTSHRAASDGCGQDWSTSPIGPTTSISKNCSDTPCKAPRPNTPPGKRASFAQMLLSPAAAIFALLHRAAGFSRRTGRLADQRADRNVVVRQTNAVMGTGARAAAARPRDPRKRAIATAGGLSRDRRSAREPTPTRDNRGSFGKQA